MRLHWLAFTVLLTLVGCEEEAKVSPVLEGRPIKMLVVGSHGGDLVREYSGEVAAAQQVQLGFEVPGQLIEFSLKASDEVKQGQTLGKLEPTQYQAARDAALARRENAKIELDRENGLVAVGGTSQASVDAAQRNYTTASADLEAAEKALRDTELKAPFDAVVGNTLVENFQSLQAKQPVVTLQDSSWLELRIQVPEADVALAEPGLTLAERNARLQVSIAPSAAPGRSFPANISEFSTGANPASRTYEVTLIFARPEDISVLPGMTARASIEPKPGSGEGSPLLVPVQAMAEETAGPFVWIVGDDGKVSKRGVVPGELMGSSIEILDGLVVGERIATSGVHHLREGLSVTPWEGQSTP
ncbi:MAG: efflux RND transporter periplasmic adaptor subunit [Planctomycetota bacterium]